jgi:CheY-like chemotaxis protein
VLLPSITILVVDDNVQVCSFMARALREGGYEVVEAHDGLAALRIIPTLPELRLLVTDVVMPGLNGFDLASHVLAASNVPILFVSAYGHSGTDVPAPLLQKPFTAEVLLEVVERLLALAHPSVKKTA